MADRSGSAEIDVEIGLLLANAVAEVIAGGRARPTRVFPFRLGRQPIHAFLLLLFRQRRQPAAELLSSIPGDTILPQPFRVLVLLAILFLEAVEGSITATTVGILTPSH